MHGGAVTLSRAYLAQNRRPDAILATGMLDLTTFLSLTRAQTSRVPVALYMHENQLTYPLPSDSSTGPMRRQRGERDHHYSFINYTSMLAADQIFFNSNYHRNAFFRELAPFLKNFPEHNELESIANLQKKSSVLPVGIDFKRLDPKPDSTERSDRPQAPLILWNQRWEYDKNPEEFFHTLYETADLGLDFKVAVCGQNFRRQPAEFERARQRLGPRIVHMGYASKEIYRSLLWESLVTISTALHEFFGISILEAVHCQTLPLLPHRLSYPELIPKAFHPLCLWDSPQDLRVLLQRALSHPRETSEAATKLSGFTQVYDWTQIAPEYDRKLERLAGGTRGVAELKG
jgi:glycosyltransferase involved in cell wall biosynthesis